MFVSILVFLLVLSILVIVHEFGHFIVAKKSGIPVLEFALGLPYTPKLWGKKIGETTYSVYPLLFGGFVRLLGEDDGEFANRPKLVRSVVIVAGVIMNFVLGIFAFAIVYSFQGVPRDLKNIKVVDISQNSPAFNSGLIVGDTIIKVDGNEMKKVTDFISYVDTKRGQKVTIENQNSKKIVVTPRAVPPQGEGPLGVTITTVEIYFPPVWERPFYGIYYGIKEAIFWGQNIASGLWTMVYSLFKGQVPKDVSGPVGIFAVTSEVAKSGILNLINFVGILSINLAILNILPFPALDGGRLLFVFIEGIIGRKVLPKVEAVIHSIGMIILLILILAVTFKDVQKLISSGGISGFINSMGK